MRILLATPTRSRPGRFKHMVRSARHTASQNDKLAIVGRIDRDDPKRREYTSSVGYQIIQGKRVRLPQAWNEIAERHRYDILMMCADDLVFRTTGWDDEVRAVFEHWPDRIGMVYADDGYQGAKMSTHSFVSKEWVNAVGYYLPDSLHGDFVDNFLASLAKSIDRAIYLPRVFIEHHHPFARKAEMDDTYAYRLTGEGPQMAQDAWNEVLANDTIPKAVEALKGAMS